jgi:hypothetical protein
MPREKWKLTGDQEIDAWNVPPKQEAGYSLLADMAADPDNDIEEVEPGIYRSGPGGWWISGPC